MGNDNTGGAGDVGILGKPIQNLNPYTHEMDLKMLPDPSGLNPSGFGNIEVEVDNSYDAKWDFKGQTLTVKTAVRIPYRFPVKNDKGQILDFQTESAADRLRRRRRRRLSPSGTPRPDGGEFIGVAGPREGSLSSLQSQWGGQMIFRQLFDATSGTYTYLLASRRGGEALIIDPVLEKVDRYLQLIRELDLKLVKAIDTHLHADHITGLGALRDRTRCITVMGEQSSVDVVSMRIADGDRLGIEGISLDVAYTPGHTDDSYSFIMADRVFTGDTLLIRGTGRTDFQNGDPRAQYKSIFNRLLRLPDETMVFPAHDYKGDTVSTIGEEKRYNPRLQVKSVDEYVDADEQPQPVQSEDDGRRSAGQHAPGAGAAGDRAPRLGGDRGGGEGADRPAATSR